MPSGKAGESRSFGSPSRYVQGPGEFDNLPVFAANYGNSAMAIIDPFFFDEFSVRITKLFEEKGMRVYPVQFGGTSSDAELERLLGIVKTLPEVPDTFIGIGGGQTCDINKAVGATLRRAFISVPTSLATDAPTSTHTIINNPGEMPRLMFHYKNPDYVVVDTDITVTAPVSMFVSGIGDALATYIEAKASFANNNVNNVAGFRYRPTLMSMEIARLCFDILMEKGRAAVEAAECHIRTQAYEDAAEATTLLSGLGFENTGVAIAHGLQAAFRSLPIRPLPHGTGVGYCMLIQLIIENDLELFEEVYDLCADIGLPVCTVDLGLAPEDREEAVEALVTDAVENRWNVKNMPFTITKGMLKNAIDYLDLYTANTFEE